MHILADDKLPHLGRLFEPLGEIECFSGTPGREQLRRADALLVRSVTPVGPELLEGTPVKFVGSATAGTDHLRPVDGVQLAHAPGSNANAVAEYVICALVHLGCRAGQRLGVLGRGHVGSRVVRYAEALGLEVCVSDPPLGLLTPLDELLDADWLTCHVPLDATTEGLITRSAGGLINTSRGEVLSALALDAVPLVLDVYDPEPAEPAIVALADMATPHVAGHSLDGKAAMVRMVYQEFCEWLGRKPESFELVPPPPDPRIAGPTDLAGVLRQVYDLAAESERFKASGADWRLRQDRPPRWELSHYRLERPEHWPGETVEILRALGLG